MRLQLHWDEANIQLNILNIYSSNDNRVSFWDKLCISPLLKEENVIIGGDLNFTLSTQEIWGSRARVDSLASYCCHIPNFALGHNGLITFAIFMRVCQIDAKGQIIAKEEIY